MLICFEKPALAAHLVTEKLALRDLPKVTPEGSDKQGENPVLFPQQFPEHPAFLPRLHLPSS